MNKLLLILLLSSVTGISYGQLKWVGIGTTGTTTSYIDTNNIKKIGKNYRVWVLYDYPTPEVNGYFKYSSYIEYMEYDCIEDRYLTLKQTMYSGRMGEGSPKEIELNEKWNYVTPTTMNDMILKKVCKK